MKRIILFVICVSVVISGCASNSNKSASEKNIYLAQQYVDKGSQYMKSRKYSSAKTAFIKAARYDPADSAKYRYAGIAAKYDRDYKEAIRLLNKAIEINPNDYKAYGHIGVITKNLKHYDVSINAFKKVLEINSAEFVANDNLAEIYFEQKDFKNCRLYMSKFDHYVSKTDAKLLSEQTRRYLEAAKKRHASYRMAASK